MKTFEVKFQILPSQGGDVRTMSIQAEDKTTALVTASLKLADEGKTHWKLIHATESTS